MAALLLGLAQVERDATRERQAVGITAARANGKRRDGRKPGSYKVDPGRVRELADKRLGKGEIATAIGVGRRTVNRMLAAEQGQG